MAVFPASPLCHCTCRIVDEEILLRIDSPDVTIVMCMMYCSVNIFEASITIGLHKMYILCKGIVMLRTSIHVCVYKNMLFTNRQKLKDVCLIVFLLVRIKSKVFFYILHMYSFLSP